jgi:hypothetical protein
MGVIGRHVHLVSRPDAESGVPGVEVGELPHIQRWARRVMVPVANEEGFFNTSMIARS